MFGIIMFATIVQKTMAQSGTNSPYSQYGLGIMSDKTQGNSRAMGGLAIALRNHNSVNLVNPASYSIIDSLTMVIDVGLSGQITHFQEGGKSRNANNANFEYVAASFRILPHIGIGLGVIPYTNIGYNYTSSEKIGASNTTSQETHSGSGGLHQGLIGIGWSPTKNISIGANIVYLWGSYEKNITISSSDNYVNTITRSYFANIRSYNADFGLQWQIPIKHQNALTFGITYSLGHSLKTGLSASLSNNNSQTGVSTSDTLTIDDAFNIPHTWGFGVVYNHNERLTLGLDYTFYQWGSLDFPEMNNQTGELSMKSGLLKNRHQTALGVEFTPNPQSMKYMGHVHYRAGASIATPYCNINGRQGPMEYKVTLGLGIPIINHWNNRTELNVSGEWAHSTANGLITENTFRINIGLKFNERWFMKWKVE